MSQGIYNNIDPTTTTGLMLSGLLDDFKDAVVSGFSGITRPTNLRAGGMWVDTSLQGSPTFIWKLKLYTGTVDIEMFRVSVLSADIGAALALDSFTIKHIANDAAGAILNLLKQRTLTGGQVKNGDTIAELRLTGCDNLGGAPVVAYIRATASEDETSSVNGVTLSLCSSPVGTGTLVEHMRFLANCVETTLPHKINSQLFGNDTLAAVTDILLTPASIITEITGSIPANVHGCTVVAGQSQVKIIHNRTTQPLTIKALSSFATAPQQFNLPGGNDLIIRPQGSIAFYYCTADSQWKYLFGKTSGILQYIFNLTEGYTEWVAPFTGDVRVLSFQGQSRESTGASVSTALSRGSLKTVLSWGKNDRGQTGIGDTANHSTPVPQVGNPQFKFVDVCSIGAFAQTEDGTCYAWGSNDYGQLSSGLVGIDQTNPTTVNQNGLSFTRFELSETAFAQTYNGTLYAWGRNQYGQLGVGDVVPRSSPVAVAGGLKFSAVFHGTEGEGSVFGVERDTGHLYAWGKNDSGQLGVGDTASRSIPVAVLNGLQFAKVAVGSSAIVALDKSGIPYSWGKNVDGELGIGGVFPRSSPVAVLGGLTFADVDVIPGTNNSFFGLTQDGILYAWGSNANGELGLGDVIPRSSPVAVLGGLVFDKMARLNAGTRSAIALQAGSGSAYAWGKNDHGQLGLNDVLARSSPVAVLGGLFFSYVTIGAGFAYGEASDARYYAWGTNLNGELGDTTLVAKSSPVAVLGFTQPFFEVPILKNIQVVKGTTYKIKIGGGASFFGTTRIGKNIRRATIAYEK